MNFAILTTYQFKGQPLAEFIPKYEKLRRPHRAKGLHSINYYAHRPNRSNLDILEIWLNLENYLENNPNTLPLTTTNLTKIVSLQFYKMVCDLQRSHLLTNQTSSKVSSLHQIYLSKTADVNSVFTLLLRYSKKLFRTYPGIAALWLGRSLNDPRALQAKIEWASRASMEKAFRIAEEDYYLERLAMRGISVGLKYNEEADFKDLDEITALDLNLKDEKLFSINASRQLPVYSPYLE